MESHVELLPGSPQYKDIVFDAISKRDLTILRSIQANFGQPIHLVKNWFYYSLVMQENTARFIVIYDQDAVELYERFITNLD